MATVKTEHRTNIEINIYTDGKTFKTHDCEIGEWWSDEICESVDFNKEIAKSNIPGGEYKVTITIEKINE